MKSFSKSIPSPYVSDKLNKKINIHERLKELLSELEDTQEVIDDIEDEMEDLESMLEISDDYIFNSVELAMSELDKEILKSNMSKYVNADKLKNIIESFLAFEDLVVPQSVFLGLTQSMDDKSSFEKLFSIYSKFHNTIVSSDDFRSKIKMSSEIERGSSGLDTLREGDVFMSVFNAGAIIADYFKAVSMMKDGEIKKSLAIFENVLNRFLKEKTLFTDVYRLFANLGVCRIVSGDYTGFDALHKSLEINPGYIFAQNQMVILKKEHKDLYKIYLEIDKNKIISNLRYTTKSKSKIKYSTNISIYIPTNLDKYFEFIKKLNIDFSNK